MKGRINWIDIARGISILLVVFGHLLSDNCLFKSMIYCFHMPMFFILSGTLLQNGKTVSGMERRITNVYFPYLIWAFIFSSFNIRNFLLILYGTNESLIKAESNGMLWFLSTLFFSGILTLAVLKYCKSKSRIILYIVVFVLVSFLLKKIHIISKIGLPLSADIVFLASSYMLIGYLYINYYNGLLDRIKITSLNLFICIMFILTSVVAVFFSTSKGYPQMATLDVGNVIIYFVSSLLPCLGIVMLAKIFERTKLVSYALIWLGKNTMAIFILHRTLLYICKNIIYKYSGILIFPMFVFLILYCCVGAFIINRYCPWLVGKTKNNLRKGERL